MLGRKGALEAHSVPLALQHCCLSVVLRGFVDFCHRLVGSVLSWRFPSPLGKRELLSTSGCRRSERMKRMMGNEQPHSARLAKHRGRYTCYGRSISVPSNVHAMTGREHACDDSMNMCVQLQDRYVHAMTGQKRASSDRKHK